MKVRQPQRTDNRAPTMRASTHSMSVSRRQQSHSDYIRPNPEVLRIGALERDQEILLREHRRLYDAYDHALYVTCDLMADLSLAEQQCRLDEYQYIINAAVYRDIERHFKKVKA